MSEKISVIVPIYKVEDYIDECISSIRNQTYRDLEIILVDDGSPDRSADICDRHAQQDDRITVIHKKNGGLSDARNAGLSIATGDYYYFVDSDDRLPPSSIEDVYLLAKKNNVQMVIAGFERFDENNNVFFSTETNGVYVSVMDQRELVKDFCRDGCRAWAVLYKRQIHEGIYFPVGEINEDEAIVFEIMERVTTAVVTNRVVYSYRCREESITTSPFSLKKLIWVKHCEQNFNWIVEKYPEFTELAAERFAGSISWAFREIALCNEKYPVQIKELKSKLKEYCQNFQKCDLEKKIRLRLWCNMHLPFYIYRFLERMLYSRSK